MKKLIAICGKAGSGKDTILHLLAQYKDTCEIVSCTTRPMREGEQEGVNYFFLSNEEFAEKLLNGDMLEATVFNDWCYGTLRSSLDDDKWNIGVFNPEGIETLMESSSSIDIRVFYVCAPAKVRLMRQLNREDDPNVDEIIRRYGADEKDFMALELKFPFTQLDNIHPGDQDWCAEKIARMCGLVRSV